MGTPRWAVGLSYCSFNLCFLMVGLAQYPSHGITVPLKICSPFLQFVEEARSPSSGYWIEMSLKQKTQM